MKKLIKNWKRLSGIHGLIVMSVYRFGNFTYYNLKIPIVKHLFWFIYKFIDIFFVRLFLNCEFPAQCKIGRNLTLPHGGKGIVLSRHVVIGDDVTIFHQVTLGIVKYGVVTNVIIEDGVLIGTGARVLGEVTVGKNANIGANAVVLKDVPAYCTAVGVPATFKPRKTPSLGRAN